ncbi:Oxaloacetate decarboxylase gamma chain [hydrothermal vent metagenome]|uniref:Oxaloacetate decarboxylase gamma chain n=1 Tax=hydrothermal vent metagenome TaxID=652676 RepID=A0A1W1EKU3_9ZZZZ
MEVSYLGESFKFMVLGMGVVFLFLLLLVWVMKVQAQLINKYFPEKSPVVSTPKPSQDEEQKRVAAIIGAVSEFRKNRQNKV